MLAILSPNCVIAIPDPGLGASFEGQFSRCMFFHGGQRTLPVTFVCAAWRQCSWMFAEYESPRRKVEVAEGGEGSYSVTITAVEDKDKEKCWAEESTGYVFHFNAGGELSPTHKIHWSRSELVSYPAHYLRMAASVWKMVWETVSTFLMQ